MINYLELNKHIISISESIIEKFVPSFDFIHLPKEIEDYETKGDFNFDNIDVQNILQGVKNKLKNHIKYRTEKGSLSKFGFNDVDDDYIIGIAKSHPKYNSFSDFYYYLQKINEYDFEKFSAKYIGELFCDFSFVTRKSSDGGIDFLGNGTFTKLLNVSNNPINLKSKNLNFKIIGQSKRYSIKNKIGTKEIREFLGSVKILQDALNPYKESAWMGDINVLNKIKLAEPFVYLFITTSYYSRDSMRLAQKLGIYFYDIDDLIFDLIDNGIGLNDNKFDSAIFEKWYK
jgi:hypothetical protein